MPLVAAIALIGLPLLMAWWVQYSLHRSSQTWLVTLLESLRHPHGSFIKRAALWVAGKGVSGVLWIVNQVDHALSVAASHSMHAVAHWLDSVAGFFTSLALVWVNFAEEVAGALEHLGGVVVPREIHKGTAGLHRGIDRLQREEARLEARLRSYARGIDRLLDTKIRPAIRALERTIEVTIPRELARARARARAIEQEIRHPSRAWLKRTARAMWALALLGLLVRTLARRFPWLFCRKVKTVGNRLCGLDQDLLNSLILDTLLIAGTISIVEFARDLQKVEGVVVDAITNFIDEV